MLEKKIIKILVFMIRIGLFFAILVVVLSITDKVSTRLELDGQWTVQVMNGLNKFCQKHEKIPYNTSIPTTFHLDLIAHKIIQNPFYGDNQRNVMQPGQCAIRYRKKFDITANLFAFQHLLIVFQGIDTYSKIKINDQQVLTTQNAFRQYKLDVKQHVIIGINTLDVEIEPTTQRDQIGQTKNRMPFKYAHTRKACYQYGWDWAPVMNTMGIWKPVYIEAYNNLKIDYVWISNKELKQKLAILNIAVALQFSQNVIAKNYLIKVILNGTVITQKQIEGKQFYSTLLIQNPKLWWPNGIGEQNLYEFNVQLITRTNQVLQNKKVLYGIRDVFVDLQNKKFTVTVNGYPIYCKGANYVPPDMFYPRIVNPNYKPGNTYRKLLDDAEESNFNMIRLWGGGQYQSDEFYQLCSRKGILIFYDFMFSDSIYPATEQFLANVQEQIIQQIRRVRNYPCLALWSGNNEILQGIRSWGWSQPQQKANYKKLFETLIPDIVKFQSPYITYIPSSPIYGIGNAGFDKGGDIHYWGVWAGSSTFEMYKRALGPFNSQFGTQALPVWQTIKQFTQPQDRNYESAVLLSHEKHGSRFNTLRRYMDIYTKKSLSFELQTYQSGLVQAFGIQTAIVAQRCLKPKSYGTLYWQFNDAWPGISWSSIDYYGRWKPLQYMAKRLYPDVAILHFQNWVYLINDLLYDVPTSGKIMLVLFNGQVLNNQTFNQTLKENQVKKFMQIPQKQQAVLYLQITNLQTNKTMKTTFVFNSFKQLELPSATLQIKYDTVSNKITFKSEKFIKNLHIYSDQAYLKLSDNYFDIVPNIPIVVQLQSHKLQEIKQKIKYRSYVQVFTQQILDLRILQ